LRPAVKNARDKFQEFSTTARKKFNDLGKEQAARFQLWRANRSNPSSPSVSQRFTWSRASVDEPSSVDAKKASAAALDNAAARIGSFQPPDVPPGSAVLVRASGPGALNRRQSRAAALRAAMQASANSKRSAWAERQGRRQTMEDAETVVDDVLALYPGLAEA